MAHSRNTRRRWKRFLLPAMTAGLACSVASGSVSQTSSPLDASVSTKSEHPAIRWPIAVGVSSFVTQSPSISGQPYPCGSGVNGQHILHEETGEENTDYFESVDIVVRNPNEPELEAEGRGADVVAVARGRVVALNNSQNECDRPFGAGNYIVLEHPNVLIDGKPLLSAYMHLNSNVEAEEASACEINPMPSQPSTWTPPALGTVVDAGQKIGELGNTGNSTGPHLHFQFATDCTLEPASAVHCPSLSVLSVNPSGFEDIRLASDESCSKPPRVGRSVAKANKHRYLADGIYVTSGESDSKALVSIRTR